MPRHAKATKRARDAGMIAGFRKYGAKLVGFNLGPGFESVASVVARFQAHLEAMEAVHAAEIAWKLAVQDEARLEAEVKELAARAASYLSGTFGPSASQLRQFGLKPRAKTRISVEAKASAVEKRRETRKARKTMGPKERRAPAPPGRNGRNDE
jgi:lipase chaperone LimK